MIFGSRALDYGRMRVALFGGSFDPPHVGHQLAALTVLETFPVDALWFVPVFQHAFDKQLAPYPHRLALCELIANSLGPRAQVCRVEERLQKPSYTLRMVRTLQQDHPGHQFSLVVGSDLLRERERWWGFAELSRLLPFLVLPRAGAEADQTCRLLPTDVFHPERLVLPPVSSTEVRAALHRGTAPTGWVSRRVLDYIAQHALYAPGKGTEPAGQPNQPSPKDLS